MRRHATAAVALAVFVLPALDGATAWAAQPSAELYTQFQYIVSVTPDPSNVICPDVPGETPDETFKYPGAGRLGATAAGTIFSGSHMWQQIRTFPATPAGGVTSWSGTEVCTFTPLPGSPTKPTVDITFDFTFTFVDGNEFLAKQDGTLSGVRRHVCRDAEHRIHPRRQVGQLPVPSDRYTHGEFQAWRRTSFSTGPTIQRSLGRAGPSRTIADRSISVILLT